MACKSYLYSFMTATLPIVPLADPDAQIMRVSSHPDPEIRGGGGLEKIFLGPSGLSFAK